MTDLIGSSILLRLVLALFIVAGGLVIYRLFNTLMLARVNARRPGLQQARPGVPALLYFTTPTCAPCKTVQRPAIQRVQEKVGDRLQVIEIDASQQTDLAGQWGVLSVPTTFVIDAAGRPRHVNHGVTPPEKLLRQVSEVL